MKISKMEAIVLKQYLQSGFFEAWTAESRARNKKQSSKVGKQHGVLWFAFWKSRVQSFVQPCSDDQPGKSQKPLLEEI